MPPESALPPDTAQRRQRLLLAERALHWRRTRRLTAILLALWMVTGFCTVVYARELARITIFGWPLSFYMAAQGAALVCLAIIGFYAWRMRQLDASYAHALAVASGTALKGES